MKDGFCSLQDIRSIVRGKFIDKDTYIPYMPEHEFLMASPIGQNKTKGSKAMKNIGITSYPTVGGSGVIAAELVVLLAISGYEVHFITSSLPFRLHRIYPSIYYHEVSMSHYP